jgi:hypothetical protein
VSEVRAVFMDAEQAARAAPLLHAAGVRAYWEDGEGRLRVASRVDGWRGSVGAQKRRNHDIQPELALGNSTPTSRRMASSCCSDRFGAVRQVQRIMATPV